MTSVQAAAGDAWKEAAHVSPVSCYFQWLWDSILTGSDSMNIYMPLQSAEWTIGKDTCRLLMCMGTIFASVEPI